MMDITSANSRGKILRSTRSRMLLAILTNLIVEDDGNQVPYDECLILSLLVKF